MERPQPSSLLDSHHELAKQLIPSSMHDDMAELSKRKAMRKPMCKPGRKDKPYIYKLPNELLLHIISYVVVYGGTIHTLCLVSKKIQSVAEEILYRNAKPRAPCVCGQHPEYNGVLYLLRTLFARPDLACKVKTLRLQTIRKDFQAKYEKNGFDFEGLKVQALGKLQELDLEDSAWRRSLSNGIESALASLLLVLMPNLVHLDLSVRDFRRDSASLEPLSALFGISAIPNAILPLFQNIYNLTISGNLLFMLTCDFPNLVTLRVKEVITPTLNRLNGPNTLPGGKNIKNLHIEPTVQFADPEYTEVFDMHLGDLFSALGCTGVKELKIKIWPYSPISDLIDADTLDAAYLIKQLECFSPTLEKLEIGFKENEVSAIVQEILELCGNVATSLRNFKQLTHVTLLANFLFNADAEKTLMDPTELPEQLEHLILLVPDGIDEYIEEMANVSGELRKKVPKLRRLTAECRDDAGQSFSNVCEDVHDAWVDLQEESDVTSYARDRTTGIEECMPDLFFM